MTGATHGTTAGLTAMIVAGALGLSPESVYVAGISAFSGALVPDFDVFWSGMAKKVSDRFATVGVVMFPGWLALVITVLITGWRRHRTITHSLLGFSLFSIATILSVVIAYIYRLHPFFLKLLVVWCVTGIGGYVIHLLEDAMTVSGVPLLFPWNKKSFFVVPERFRIKTGTWQEGVLLLGFVGAFLLIFHFRGII